MLITALACLTLLSGQSAPDRLQQKVTFQTVALPVGRAVEELGKTAGVPLLIAPVMANNVLVLGLKDVPLQQALDRIADVTSGRWQPEGEGFRLVRDVARQNREAQDELRARTEAIRKSLAGSEGMMGGVAAPVSGNTVVVQGRVNRPNAGVSGMDLMRRAMDPATLAQLEQGGRIVYSSNPTMMQRPMTVAMRNTIPAIINEHNAAVAERDVNAQPDTDEMRAAREMAAQFGMPSFDKKIEPPAKVLVIVTSQGFPFQSLTLDVRMFDAKGDTVYSQRTMLPSQNSPFDGIEFTPEGQIRERNPAEQGDQTEIPLSEESKLFAEANRGFGGPDAMSPPNPALRGLLLRPDLKDPLSFRWSDAVLGVAKAKNVSVVANLPDSALSIGELLRDQGAMKLGPTMAQLLQGRHMQGELKDGWLTVRPARPHEARTKRVDRAALAALLGAADRRRGYISLDDFAAYAVRNEPPLETFAALYLGQLAPNALGVGIEGPLDWNVLRLYGTFGPTQRTAFRSGFQIGFTQLGPNQRNLVERILFGADARLQVGPAKEDGGGLMSMAARFMPAGSKSWRDEPTEVMPSGLPANGVLQVSAQTEEVGTAVTDQPGMMDRFVMDADMLAMFEFFRTSEQMAAMSGMMPTIKGLRLGTRTQIKFTFTVAPEVTSNHTLNDDNVSPSATVTAMDQLPAALQERIKQRVQALKNDPMLRVMPMGGMPRPGP